MKIDLVPISIKALTDDT